MIRSNIFARRIATTIAPKHAVPSTASTASSAINALVTSSSSTSTIIDAPAAIHYFSTPLTTSSSLSSRQFSSTTPYSSDAATELGSILQREIEEETEAASEFNGKLPPELAELDAEIRTKWTVVEGITGIGGGETGSGASMRMFRKEGGSKGAKIGIVFHCQDTEEDVKFDTDAAIDHHQSDEDQSTMGEDEEEEPAQAVRFGVTVSKGGKTVVLSCRSDAEGHIDVESVVVRDGDAESVLAALAGGEGMHAALYQGPEFTELAEDLQQSFNDYVVKECGLDENVAAYIIMYSDYREQEEYLSWMKTAQDILD